MVFRRPDPQDGQRSLVELTASGLDALHATRARREDWLTQTVERELDPEQRQLLRQALTCSTGGRPPERASVLLPGGRFVLGCCVREGPEGLGHRAVRL
jgi:hypothetical protein